MIWNDHSRDHDEDHALFAPSSTSYLNTDFSDVDAVEELIQRKRAAKYATKVGTVLHDYAQKRIKLGMRLNKAERNSVVFYLLTNGIPEDVFDIEFIFENLRTYINDCILHRMNVEQKLKFSDIFYGTADAISFEKNRLKIFDLKTGRSPVHIEQLMQYAALFCLEYGYKPSNIEIELRIYQADQVAVCEVDPNDIKDIINSMRITNKIYHEMRGE